MFRTMFRWKLTLSLFIIHYRISFAWLSLAREYLHNVRPKNILELKPNLLQSMHSLS